MPCRSSRTRVCRVSSHSTRSAERSSARTRSVTSSRLPIGVAQTASGTTPLQRLEADETCADQPGSGCELGAYHLHPRPRVPQRVADNDLTRGAEEEVAGRGK